MTLPAAAFDAPEVVRLREELVAFLRPFDDRTGDPPPVGRWLAEELVLFARDDTGESQRATARRLGVAESGLRSRIRRVEDGRTLRPENWWPVRFTLRSWGRSLDGSFPAFDVLRLNVLLASDPVFRTFGQVAKAAGVTEPTGRKWIGRLEEERSDFLRQPRSPGPTYHERKARTAAHLISLRGRRDVPPERQVRGVLALRGETLEDLAGYIGAGVDRIEAVLTAARDGEPCPEGSVARAIARETGVTLF